VPLLRAVQLTAEWRHRAAQSDDCGDGSGPPQAEGNACCLHPQPLAHQGSQRQDVVRGLAWVQADGLSPTGLQLPRIRQGSWPHWQAQRQEHYRSVHRLHGGLEGLLHS
jgi:hypothetical protein